MEKIRIGLVGCGGMGIRHLIGLGALTQTPFFNVELGGVCDLRRENAEQAAAKAEELFGVRPPVCTTLDELAKLDLQAVDVVVDPSVHQPVVCQALELGLHVLVEKPMAITVSKCRLMMEAARKHDRLLSVAENYRRDPSARLVNHLLQQQVIGKPYLAYYHSLGGGSGIYITPWRHLKERGGLLLDMGIHLADLIRYQLGDIDEVYGAAWLAAPVRQTDETQIQATAEDCSMAMLRMKSGVMVNWMMGRGGLASCGGQLIAGRSGTLTSFGTRGGKVSLRLGAGDETGHEQILEETTGFELEPLAEHLFPQRLSTRDADAKLIALELHELGEAVLQGRALEVDGEEGLKDVAAIYAILESSLANEAVKMADVESGQVCAYQNEIDLALSTDSTGINT
ncbi:MAG TPA: Gfo/Idh/MocA family oxidoreductase [Candidatus Handelsmanbacteria bacterium]|nr:Gfo/Idh/MocA family oxidoreductase [Candidatus Handelsmanbacteria bacterium]